MSKFITPEEKNQTVILKKKENLYFLVLNNTSNNFNNDFVRKIHEKLDEVEKSTGPAALLTIATDEKLWSTGLDLGFLSKLTKPETFNFLQEFIRLLGRFLLFPVPTIAVMSGHAVAGGCMLAFAHDYRIMAKGRPFFSLNEVELGFPLPPGMNATVQCKVTPKLFRDMILTGKRMRAEEAFTAGAIDQVSEPEKIFDDSIAFANQITKFGENRTNFKLLKEEMHRGAIKACFTRGLYPGVRSEYDPLPKL